MTGLVAAGNAMAGEAPFDDALLCETPVEDGYSRVQLAVETSRAPAGPIVVLGEAQTTLRDNGRFGDLRANDGIYSSWAHLGDTLGGDVSSEGDSCARAGEGSLFPKAEFGFELECEIEFVEPGGTCSGTGETCPTQSALGGETWFCVCVFDCKVTLGGSIGNKNLGAPELSLTEDVWVTFENYIGETEKNLD